MTCSDFILQIRQSEECRNDDRREHFEQVRIETYQNDYLVNDIIDDGTEEYTGKTDSEILRQL